ncbi:MULTISPECIES: ribosomal protein S18-alanine N-acetyltransferase [Pasteurellaceae]|uniref:[Ribosomal protein bS18]-alanine N-acetyltransferase n=1 Tax=Pasteurella atlantica TaxID=2827233 RepID=A0AAW8CSJ6_9PAST|nr:ribosomal protein S18-alanine N-acetyltransferase [Pasteurella atlantica]MBR0573760.1 ribosomal protein S18-alanine N-acetyltransferase [Pasteurella atlantica]MDP8039696.1 ribosomal protein S18-alanine N-acetyltransferase [Pasteurella atlantica]MDP8041881.1 ribosomal protein S18-alanine N-acetyltransferase [Pasteurella atlantica]MDP8044094.1 ribosomal protein S18-alanine N-acetyltransferase [Pasteurella atlantica]MDP8046072.1 ribosomal protein S18-alanine N-acetyltransferase [Pasteurella at
MITNIKSQDFDLLFEIEQKAHPVPWSKGTLLNNQGERYLNLKLIEEDQIVGFAICYKTLDEATLFNIAVDPEFQGKDYGKRLLNSLILQLKQQGIITLWLEVRESNRKAIQLYQHLDFVEVDIRKNYYPTPNGGKENAIVMALYL